ncbi:alanyl-tRNA synthetase [Ferrithrix thermotolerans DSM 19514]|uniref:Alanine--tRNA ligase n=1 Tax=Ferrithrix thermotolerans DSM 19514 TaxID=1121881 RepID=A0A1M4SH93_9ACTN|nr:alanine--tRNA ligase [Ferrithrix thermotolerans]SHE31603.1 alanyl-tRNA synthetase [Ferrithrix thermotolerans DSM 19514]
MDSNELRQAFTKYFVDRGHVAVPSASLIPHDNTILFTVAGMVPFKRYFLGEEIPPYKRATSIQKCVRAGGKHNDLDQIGKTLRHLTFFEMLGNFSFGDYFKEAAIPFAWGFVTEVLKLDPSSLWVTVHTSDDEAASIWEKEIGVPPERIQRLEEDNWWQMADVGPCGPCSEIYYDKGPSYGEDGGPAFGSDERFLEIWNLVFMQYVRDETGELSPLPKPSIDTGAGLERIVPILQGKGSVYETDLMVPMIKAAEKVTGVTYGSDDSSDVSLRIIADHARTMTFLVSDGVFPTNEGRGYVLRRIIRRAVLRAYMLGAKDNWITASLVDAVVDTMGDHYVDLRNRLSYIKEVITREEEAFRHRIMVGVELFEREISNSSALSGEAAFRLHDTYGFPIELTVEMAQDRRIAVDVEGFESEMLRQRTQSRKAGLGGKGSGTRDERLFRVLEDHGPTQFTGYDRVIDEGRVLAFLPVEDSSDLFELYLDRTPFYPEGGGQVGDKGSVSTETAELEVVDTNYALSQLIRHVVRVVRGEVVVGSLAKCEVNEVARSNTRRNHTGTHLLHFALRSVLGEHVKQQGSLVEPNRLRFDFTHWGPLTKEEIRKVEVLIFKEIVSDAPVEVREMDKDEAIASGAIAFFGDRYQDVVRVVRAGEHSVELCGGTHVSRLGAIGLLKIVSESSIGANTRRIEAVTGEAALEYLFEMEDSLDLVAETLKTSRSELPSKVAQTKVRERELLDEIKKLRSKSIASIAKDLLVVAKGSYLVARVDGLSPEELKDLALSIRSSSFDIEAVVLAGVVGDRVGVVCSVKDGFPVKASDVIEGAARVLGGGVGRQSSLALSGGREIGRVDEALSLAKSFLEDVNF